MEEPEPELPSSVGFDPDLLSSFLSRFGALKSRHLVEELDEGGGVVKRRVVSREINEADLKSHLKGDERRSVYIITSGGQLKCAQVQVKIEGFDQNDPFSQAHETKLNAKARDFASTWIRAAQRMGLSVHLERVCAVEYRVWMFFEEKIPMGYALKLIKRLEVEVGETPSGIERAYTPSVARLTRIPGPHVQLPLGYERATSSWSVFIDPTSDQPIPDPIKRLSRRGDLITQEQARRVARAPRSEGPQHKHPIYLALRAHEPALRVAMGCGILTIIIEKSLRLGHLDGMERASIYESFRYLERPIDSLLAILSATGDTRKTIQRRLQRRGEFPISCATMRKRHGLFVKEKSCSCQFKLCPGAYPSPVLHALKPEQVAGMKQRVRARREQRRARGPAIEKPTRVVQGEPTQPLGAEPETVESLARRLTRLREAEARIHRDIAEVEAALGALFDVAGVETVSLSKGRLVRVRGEPNRFDVEG